MASQMEPSVTGGTSVPGFFRKPYGPGWALVGDAGYTKDPVTALGISDAFLDAERCAQAIEQWLSGARPYAEAMADYQRSRDERALPLYGLTCDLAMLHSPAAEMQRLLAAVHGNQEAMDDFASMMVGALPVPEFFAPSNVERLIAAADGRAAATAGGDRLPRAWRGPGTRTAARGGQSQ